MHFNKIQENYLNYRPSSAGKDDNGVKRMSLIARAAESIGDGDIINVQILIIFESKSKWGKYLRIYSY